MNIVFGIFLIAHGAVHALYAAHAMRLIELSPGMTWPDGSWALSGLIGDTAARSLVAVAFLVVAVGFAATGTALIARQSWWGVLATAAAVISTVVIALAWNGRFHGLSEQGLFAIIINVVVVVSALVLHWPRLQR